MSLRKGFDIICLYVSRMNWGLQDTDEVLQNEFRMDQVWWPKHWGVRGRRISM